MVTGAVSGMNSGGMDQRGQARALAARHHLHDVLEGGDADRIVDEAPVDRDRGVADLGRGGQHLVGRRVDLQPLHVGPRRHDGADPRVGEVEDLVDQLGLRALEDAGGRPFPDQVAHLLLRDRDGGGRVAQADTAQHEPRGRRQEGDDTAGHAAEPGDGAGREAGDALGIAQGDGLRHQLPDDERHVGDHDDDEGQRERGRRPAGAHQTSTGVSASTAVAPPTAEASVPTRVIAIWIVARKRSGACLARARGWRRGRPAPAAARAGSCAPRAARSPRPRRSRWRRWRRRRGRLPPRWCPWRHCRRRETTRAGGGRPAPCGLSGTRSVTRSPRRAPPPRRGGSAAGRRASRWEPRGTACRSPWC